MVDPNSGTNNMLSGIRFQYISILSQHEASNGFCVLHLAEKQFLFNISHDYILNTELSPIVEQQRVERIKKTNHFL